MMEIRLIRAEEMERWAQLVSQLSPQASLGEKTERSAWLDLTAFQEKVIFVVVDGNKIVGTASVLLEAKVNRGTIGGEFYDVAHVEEVVVDKDWRGMGIGAILMDRCVAYARDCNAYKVILDCSEENVEFYEKCGFERYEVCMRMSL